MYLQEIYLENTGPITKCHVELPFADNGNPLPVVIVGPNGSGKSIYLSYIVDALMEFATRVFADVGQSDGLSHQYFRYVRSGAIKSGELYSLSLLRFKANDDNLYYCEKSGILDPVAYSPCVKSVFASVWQWPQDENYKEVLGDEKTIKTEMLRGSYAFFPASRHEQPDWLNPKSLKIDMDVSVNRRFSDDLDKPIWVETCAEENIPWILDVFLDSLIDSGLLSKVQTIDGHNVISHNISASEVEDIKNRTLLSQARRNVELILQAVLQDDSAKLSLNYRNIGPSRIRIEMEDRRIIPTLQSLSEGQSQLLHLFTTIIRYGERTDLIRSVHLSQITGLVVIDEIDAHLHPSLQHDVLPKLIKLFPKVQFIVSSHSPLFLLGMEKEFDVDKLDILELPDGNRINSERFSEFGKAFEYYQTTETFEREIEQRFADMTKPVVLTEGKTDAQYIHTALELLGEEDLLKSLEIKPVGKEGDDGDNSGGKSGLNQFYKVYAAKPSFFHQPILLLYDWDANKEADQIEKLWVRSIQPNPENTKVKKGIENLFSIDLFEKRFYKTEIKEGDYGECNKIDEFKKKEFCQWICEERRNPADFEGFKKVVEILTQFVKVHQAHLN